MSENLFDQLEQQKQQQIEEQVYRNDTAVKTRDRFHLAPDDADTGRAAAPYDPVPKEARKKSLTGMASSLFRSSKSSKRKEVHEGNDGLDGLVQSAKQQEEIPVVEMEHVHTEIYEESKQKASKIYDFLETDLPEDEVKREKATEGLKDFTVQKLTDLKVLSAYANNKGEEPTEEQFERMSEAIDFFVTYNNEMKEVAKGSQKEIDSKYAVFYDRYHDKYGLTEKDHEILGTYAALYKEAHGALSIEALKKTKEGKKLAVNDYTGSDEEFINKELIDLNKPEMIDGKAYTKRTMIMKEFKQPLFLKDPNPQDIRQGNVGDCFFIAALNAVMEKDPDTIKNMMEDNGDSVTVRFFKRDGKPLYVKVKKSAPKIVLKAEDGSEKETVNKSAMHGGAALWVAMMEKAYAAARVDLENEEEKNAVQEKIEKDKSLYGGIDGGSAESALKAILGPQVSMKTSYNVAELRGIFMKTSLNTGSLGAVMQADQLKKYKENLTAEGKEFDAVQWNIEKAKEFFGVEIKDENDELYQYFSNDSAIKLYDKYFKFIVSKKFTNGTLWGRTDAFVLADFLKQTKSQLPDLKVPGLDQEKTKDHFIKYLSEYFKNTERLSQTVNTDGQYSDQEKDLYDKIAGDKKSGKILMTNTKELTFSRKEGIGISGGERVVYGVAGLHQYSIRDVVEEERTIAGRKVKLKFLVVVNPWKNMARQYDKDGRPYMVMDDKKNNVDTGGAFKMELRDFISTFGEVQVF